MPVECFIMDKKPIITITTDFGVSDGYVGVMKGVILGILPDAQLVDISHDIGPQNVRQAAYVLYTVYGYFPPHTVHLVVVDPGVGSARRPIAMRTSRGTFVGPDNGVFSYVMAHPDEPVEALVALENPRYRLPRVSNTFHGRDVFAPAAAHLAAGVPIAELGRVVHDPVRLPLPRLVVAEDHVLGEVLHADRFGNVITSIGVLSWPTGTGRERMLALAPAFSSEGSPPTDPSTWRSFSAERTLIHVKGQTLLEVHRTYAEVEPGNVLALVGSEGYLEIAVREGNAAQTLGLRPGDPIELRFHR